MPIRVGASAIIVRDNSLLLVEFDEEGVGVHYNLPGGGVEDGELLEDAVRREVLEETCLQVDVGRMLFVFEYVPSFHRYKYGARHSVNVIFECNSQQGSEARMPDVPDLLQIGVRWVPLAELTRLPLLPKIGESLIEAIQSKNSYPTILRETT
jgi:ADP-ribose pyrophosphatase YjhB (NUDIX family)